jgi:hypothetical protein
MNGRDRSRFSLETHLKSPTSSTMTTPTTMTSILTVTNVTKEDDADYECVVSNPFGKTSHKVRLLVQGQLDWI